MITRRSILSVLLVAANITVMAKTYQLWQEGPWEIPQPVAKEAAVAVVDQNRPVQLAMSIKTITDNNLFDPERGASKNQETQAVALATQKIRSMVLTGTMILGESRYAIFQGGSDRTRNPDVKTSESVVRLKLGDSVDGFHLSQVEDNRVAFTNGTTRIEIALDFFRKIEEGKVQAAPAAPMGSPNVASQAPRLVPRRSRPVQQP